MIAVGAWVALAAPRGVDFGVPPPAGLERAYASRRVALVVGIDAYHDPALGNLAWAAKDATDLASAPPRPRARRLRPGLRPRRRGQRGSVLGRVPRPRIRVSSATTR